MTSENGMMPGTPGTVFDHSGATALLTPGGWIEVEHVENVMLKTWGGVRGVLAYRDPATGEPAFVYLDMVMGYRGPVIVPDARPAVA
jgi:hypothetical protein